jgi:hypothetical protein
MKLILTIILMNGYVHTFQMDDVKYDINNCDKFFKRLTKVKNVNNRNKLYYHNNEVFAYSCSHEQYDLVYRIKNRLGLNNKKETIIDERKNNRSKQTV